MTVSQWYCIEGAAHIRWGRFEGLWSPGI